MQVLIFKTNVQTKKRVKLISPLFTNHPVIKDWSVDLEDCDRILRIVAQEPIKAGAIIYMMNMCGYYCELLND